MSVTYRKYTETPNDAPQTPPATLQVGFDFAPSNVGFHSEQFVCCATKSTSENYTIITIATYEIDKYVVKSKGEKQPIYCTYFNPDYQTHQCRIERHILKQFGYLVREKDSLFFDYPDDYEEQKASFEAHQKQKRENIDRQNQQITNAIFNPQKQ